MGNQPSLHVKEDPPPSPNPPSACPVDHSARKTYLAAASEKKNPPTIPQPHTEATTSRPPPAPRLKSEESLSVNREISSIPRATTSPPTTTPSPTSLPVGSSESHPSNPTPSNSKNWIYPSEKMFFDAMRRKSYAPESRDMSVVVPIHNAVNERAWSEILAWETKSARAREQNKRCGGPQLRSFSGDSKKLSPRARWKSLLGYSRPFDRHDWVVQRCGGKEGGEGTVEYLIDFYKGSGGR
ncbi:uncharacterized protein KY384_006868 [Bacidia gigantensis]|uniref:uncharacterized protein n=1 Tax=Bacidia gigantensis TaxID=2732470 RepID=UPI001D0424AC|nr:uncharacterized protein KY384_006868 [Bacidia gigantensis]KAG8527952.1 hypothetical protein KY384_006868 [Bacidia gigantensis]